VVGIQIGNEIPGQQSAAISTVAQNLRSAHNAAGFNSIEVVGALIEGQASTFCPVSTTSPTTSTVPSAVPVAWPVRRPVWPSGNVPAQTCWAQVQGVSPGPEPVRGCERRPGETGYNTGYSSV
jgi:hypothetical protein